MQSLKSFLRGLTSPVRKRDLSDQSVFNLLTAGFTGKSHFPELPEPFIALPAPYLALRNTTVYSCVKLIAESIATLQVRLIDSDSNETVSNHPVARLFQSPNDDQTWSEFMETMLANYVLWGNAYCEIELTNGRPTALYPMTASRVVVLRSNDRLFYEYMPLVGSPITLGAQDVLHLRMFGVDELMGIPPVWAVHRALKLALSQENLLTEAFADGVRPDYIVSLPPEKALERLQQIDEQSLKRDKATIQGQIEGARTRRGLYVPFGYDVKSYTANFQQAQLGETRDQQVAEIARIFRVPLSKLAVASKAINQSAAEGEQLSFFQDTLRPIIVKLEEKLEADLLSPTDQGRYEIKFDVRDVLRGDIATQTDQFTKLWAIGCLTSNEIRDVLGYTPFRDDRASSPQFPVNMTTESVKGAPQLTNPADPKAPVPELPATPTVKQNALPAPENRTLTVNTRKRSLDARKKAAERSKPLFHEAVSRIVRKERAVVMKDAKSILSRSKDQASNLVDRLQSLYSGELRTFIHAQSTHPIDVLLAGMVQQVESDLDRTFDDPDIAKIRTQYQDIWTRQYIDSSLGQMVDLINNAEDDGDVLSSLNERFDQWEQGTPETGKSRADKQADNEPNRGLNVFTRALASLAGVSAMRWVSSSPCEYCEPYDGKVFSTNSDHVDPPLHSQCSCVLDYAD